jgi:hypothetical protein
VSKKKTGKRLSATKRFGGMMEEARASAALDGKTQFCLSCEMGETAKHTCGKRPMSEEERAVVEAAMDLELPRAPWLKNLMAKCRALRAARSGKR